MKWWALAGGLAFYVSLLTHAALMLYLLHHDLKHFWLYLPPLPRAIDGMFMQVDEHDPPLRNRIGEETGKGFGSHQSDGHDLLYALLGPQDQAWLSRDPVAPGPRIAEPSPNTSFQPQASADGSMPGPIGVLAPGQELIAPTVAPPPQLVKLLISASPQPIAPGPIDPDPPATQPADHAIAVSVSAQPAVSASISPDTTAHAPGQANAGNAATPADPAADPAPQSDSDSDAFARIGSVRFKNGKLDVRLGRKVKTVKPRFTIKGSLDQISLVNPVTVVRVTIADTGKVSDVRVIRSSGSNELDLPWVLAVYKWWFEPASDATGKPATDVIQLSLGVIDRAY